MLYKGNYKRVLNQLRLLQPIKSGVLDPTKVSASLGGETHRRDPCQALPPRLPVHLVLVVQAILSEQQNLLHFGYVAYTGSFVDLSEVPVSDVVPGLEAGSMMTRSLPRMVKEPKGDLPFLLLRSKIFFIAEPMGSKHTSPPSRLFTVP